MRRKKVLRLRPRPALSQKSKRDGSPVTSKNKSVEIWRNSLGNGSRSLTHGFGVKRSRLIPFAASRHVGSLSHYGRSFGTQPETSVGEMITADQEEPLRLSLRLYKTRTRNDHIPLQMLAVPGDGKKRTFSFETWIDARWVPQLIWENAPTDRDARSDMLVQKFLPDKFREAPDRREIKDKKQYDEARAKWQQEMTTIAYENYQGPSLRVYSVTLSR